MYYNNTYTYPNYYYQPLYPNYYYPYYQQPYHNNYCPCCGKPNNQALAQHYQHLANLQTQMQAAANNNTVVPDYNPQEDK